MGAANSNARNIYLSLNVLNRIVNGVVSSHESGKYLERGGEVCEDALKWESKKMYWDCWNDLTGRKEVLRRS